MIEERTQKDIQGLVKNHIIDNGIIRYAYRNRAFLDVTENSVRRYFNKHFEELMERFYQMSIKDYMESDDYIEDEQYYYEHRRETI